VDREYEQVVMFL